MSKIVRELLPELLPTLTKAELESTVVLRDGFHALDRKGAMEIIRFSITEHQKDAILH